MIDLDHAITFVEESGNFPNLPIVLFGHSYFNDETYTDEFNAEFDKWLETLDYDYDAAENKERFSEDKADYLHKNLDRDKWCHSLDTELFEDFVEFYDDKLN